MKTYFYDGTLDGFLTTVFHLYEQNDFGAKISQKTWAQNNLFEKDCVLQTNEQKASRVKGGIVKKAGAVMFDEFATVFCNDNPEKENIIFEYLKLVFAFGQKARLMLNNPSVIAYNELLKKVTYERHRMIGFMRFEETLDGVMYAKYSPDNNITALLLHHFANRFGSQDLIIHDTKRGVLGVYSKLANKFFTYTTNNALQSVETTNNESFFKSLWQSYYKHASIAERENTKLMTAHMPRRYHQNLTELKG